MMQETTGGFNVPVCVLYLCCHPDSKVEVKKLSEQRC